MFNSEIGELIGIKVVEGVPFGVRGITGDKKLYYLHTVILKVGGWPKEVKVGFMDVDSQEYGVVGQNGFFDTFVVTFDLAKGIIELKQRIK